MSKKYLQKTGKNHVNQYYKRNGAHKEKTNKETVLISKNLN